MTKEVRDISFRKVDDDDHYRLTVDAMVSKQAAMKIVAVLEEDERERAARSKHA
jgi:hypothetical protein